MPDYVKIHDTYYGPDSPLDGLARSLLTTLLHLARLNAQRMRAVTVTRSASVTVTPDAGATVTPRERHSQHEPVPIAWCNGAPLSVRQIAAAAGLTPRQTKRALERLEAIGEITPTPGGGVALLGYWRTQETPAAARKRRSRARARALDARASAAGERLAITPQAIEPPPAAHHNPATSLEGKRDSHADSHAPSHADGHTASHARVAPLPNAAAAHDADISRGRAWLDALCQSLFTRPAPYPNTRYERDAYATLGRKTQPDLDRVAQTITRLVRSRPDLQLAQYYTAGHVLRYWLDYLAGHGPSSSARRLERPARPAPLQPASAAELAAEAVL